MSGATRIYASLLSALDGCSMVVVPYDGGAIMQGVEAAAALQYTLENPAVPAVIAYNRAEASDFERHEWFGVQIAKVGDDLPRDVSAVIAAADRSCAAYECLQADETRSLAGSQKAQAAMSNRAERFWRSKAENASRKSGRRGRDSNPRWSLTPILA